MISGRETLGSIQSAVKAEQERVRQLELRMAESSERLLQIDVARGKELQALAGTRVRELAAGRLAERVAGADRQVLSLLERRRRQHGELEGQLAAAAQGREDLVAERERWSDTLEAAVAAIDEAEAATQARLATDDAYLARQQSAKEAERVAVHADEKATLSEEEKEQKGVSYSKDPLFSYLWRRGYGTTAYRAWGITKALDAWVARLIGYADARPNFVRLQELPLRLREHAEESGRAADAEFEALKAMDQAARVADGIPALETKLEEVQAKLADTDARIAAAAAEHDALLARLETWAAGGDEDYQRAVTFLSSEFGREDLQALRREALATPFPEDDLIVARLLDLERDREQIASTLEELKRAGQQNQTRLRELEKLRQDYTRQGFDQPGQGFTDGALVGALLSQVVGGLLDATGMMRVLGNQRVYTPQKANVDFGSGGFGKGSPWGKVLGDVAKEGLGDLLGDLLSGAGQQGRRSSSSSSSGGWSSSSRSTGRGNFGGTSRARSSGSSGGGKRSSGGSKGGSSRGGGFKTGGKF